MRSFRHCFILKLFEGPKLTKISPNKTISELNFRSFTVLTIISLIYFFYIDYSSVNFYFNICLVACQLVICFFYLKEKQNKKTGNFLPDTEDLDRLDGILLAYH